jgi:hypothetical protein
MRLGCPRPVLKQTDAVFELLDAEEEVIVGLSVRHTRGAQTLLHGGIHKGASPRRALAGPVHHTFDHGAALLALHTALLD